jgi:hypothetical protein
VTPRPADVTLLAGSAGRGVKVIGAGLALGVGYPLGVLFARSVMADDDWLWPAILLGVPVEVGAVAITLTGEGQRVGSAGLGLAQLSRNPHLPLVVGPTLQGVVISGRF